LPEGASSHGLQDRPNATKARASTGCARPTPRCCWSNSRSGRR